MTRRQFNAVAAELDLGVTELHHGDCVGADKQAFILAGSKQIRTVAHPAKRAGKLWAHTQSDEVRVPYPPLTRNRHIVDETERLVATPKEGREVLRSGTWATIRYAKKRGKPVVIIYPDGRRERLAPDHRRRT